MIFTEVQREPHLKSAVYCINTMQFSVVSFHAELKLLGPDSLLHVNINLQAKVKMEQTFFLELVMCINSSSNHS